MESPRLHINRSSSPLFLSRSKSSTGSKKSSNTTLVTSSAASNASSHTPTRSRSTSPTKKYPLSAPPTWRAKFASATKPLRRSKLNINTLASSPTRLSTTSTASAASAHSRLSQRSNFSYAGSEAEICKAEVVEVVRAGPAKFVDARSPHSPETGEARQGTAQNRKLLQHYGVRQSDRAFVAMQRASGGRVSAFREEFEQAAGDRVDRDKALPARPREDGDGRGSEELSEGVMKWFRCDIFPANARDFHAAETEAKQLVVEGGGKVMDKWTYPGGFMFQIPRNIVSPLPPTIPLATPTPEYALLSTHLGETGMMRVTEFQPYLEPMQHLLQLASAVVVPSPNSPSTVKSAEDSQSDYENFVSAIEYIAEVEEIPLLRSSPAKSTTTKQRQSWQDSNTLSPQGKTKLQSWLVKQQGSAQAKRKRREGQVYGTPGSHYGYVLKKIEEVVEEEDCDGDDEEEWESDHGESTDAGSEFSIATGLESVRFVAQYGSLF